MKKINTTPGKRFARAIAVEKKMGPNVATTPFAGFVMLTVMMVTGCCMLSSPSVQARVADVTGMTNHFMWLAAFLLSGTQALIIFRSAKEGE